MRALVLIGIVTLILCAGCYVIAAWADDTIDTHEDDQ